VAGMSGFGRGMLRAAIRIGVIFVVMILAIAVPSFDRVMALLGSAFCFNICIILPCCFYLRLVDDISAREKVLLWSLILPCSIMGTLGTVWAFLPAEVTGARRIS
jgi:solute carrier family 32 (vesicular inhibitory amino acid transporter)